MEIFEIRGRCVKEAQQLELKIHSGSQTVAVPAGPSKSMEHEWKLNIPLKNLSDPKDPKIKIEVIAKKATLLGQDLDYGETDAVSLKPFLWNFVRNASVTPAQTANAMKKGATRVELSIWAVGSKEAVAESIRKSEDVSSSLVAVSSQKPSLHALFQNQAVCDAAGDVLSKGESSSLYGAVLKSVVACLETRIFEGYRDTPANWSTILAVLNKSKDAKILAALVQTYVAIFNLSESWKDAQVKFVIDHGFGSSVDSTTKYAVSRWISYGISSYKDIAGCKPLEALAEPIKSMLASENSDSDLADLIKSCKRLLSNKGFAANSEICGLKDAIIALAKGTANPSANKAALDLCDKAKWLSKDVAKLDSLRDMARKIISTAEGDEGVMGCDLDDLTALAQKIGAIFEDAEHKRIPNYDEETPLQSKTRCVKQTPEIVKAIWSDETLMKAFVYCICYPHAHGYAAQEFNRGLKPAYAPMIQWVLTGRAFEIVAGQVEHFATMEDLSRVMMWLSTSIAWSDIQTGYANEEECQKIYAAFESSRLAQKICEKLSDNSDENPQTAGLAYFVGLLSLDAAYFKYFSRLLRVGLVDSIRDFLKTFSNEDTHKTWEANIMFYLCMYDFNGGDLDSLAEGTPEEWIAKLREFFFPIYQSDDMTIYCTPLAIEVVGRCLKKYTQDEELLNAMWQFSIRLVLKHPHRDSLIYTKSLIEPIFSLFSGQGGKMGTLSGDDHNLFADLCCSATVSQGPLPFNVLTVKTIMQQVAKRVEDTDYISKVIKMCKRAWDNGLSSAWTQSGVLSRAVLHNLTQSAGYYETADFINNKLCFSPNFSSFVVSNKKMDTLLKSERLPNNCAAMVVAGSSPEAYQQFKVADGWKIVAGTMSRTSSHREQLAFIVLFTRAINEPNKDLSLMDDVSALSGLAQICGSDNRAISTMSMEALYVSVSKRGGESDIIRKLSEAPHMDKFWTHKLPNIAAESLCSLEEGEVVAYDASYGQFEVIYCAAKLVELGCKHGLKPEANMITQRQLNNLLETTPGDKLRSSEEVASLFIFTHPEASWYKGGQPVWLKVEREEYPTEPAIGFEAYAAVLDACKAAGKVFSKNTSVDKSCSPILREKALGLI